MSKKYMLQHDSRDCGATCLSMIANYYHKNLSIAKARVYTKTDKSGCNLYGIVDAAKYLSLKADAMSGSHDELIKAIEDGEIKVPFIAHIISEQEVLHYVVVYKMTEKEVVMGDPAKGKVTISTKIFFNMWTGYVVGFEKTEDFKPDGRQPSKIFDLFKVVNIKDRRIGLMLFLSIITSVIGVMGAFVFKIILSDTFFQEGYKKINAVFIVIISLYLILGIVEILRGKIIANVAQKIDISLATGYFSHLIGIPVYEIGKWQTGEFLTRLSDISVIRDILATGLVSIILDVSMIVVCGIILINLNLIMFVISFAIICIYLLLTVLTKERLENLNRDTMSKAAMFHSLFKETVDGIQTVKMTDTNGFIEEGVKRYQDFSNLEKKNNITNTILSSIVVTIEIIGIAVILWVGFIFVKENRISIGDLMTFYALLSYFITPGKNLAGIHPSIQAAIISMERLNDMMEISEEDKYTGKSIPSNVNKWELKNIDFRYGNNELVLKGINISVCKGEKIALVGESGCGKTSIAKLLMNFYTPEKGKITIDEKEYNEYSIESIRKSISYIGQDSYLFSKTLKENLLIGTNNISTEELNNVCEQCCITEFSNSLPGKLDTPIDENGMNLSSGQRQRVVIGRALLRNPHLLILDEATSNLDLATEKSITDTINALGNNVACIVIAHRLSTIEKCDRIYVLKDGEIVGSGTHLELSQNCTEYKRLLSNQ